MSHNHFASSLDIPSIRVASASPVSSSITLSAGQTIIRNTEDASKDQDWHGAEEYTTNQPTSHFHAKLTIYQHAK